MREGLSAQSDNENSAEYYYRSRTTYNGQITGKHTFALDELDWSASYSYANATCPTAAAISSTTHWSRE